MSLGNFPSKYAMPSSEHLPSEDTVRLFNLRNIGQFKSMLQRGITLISNKLHTCKNPSSGILPHELAQKFRDVDLNHPQDTLDHAIAELESLYLKDAVYFHLPNYMAHLNPPITNAAIFAELIQASLNTAVDTWDQSAGATFIEQKLVDWTMARIGFDSAAGDGVFTSGGTQSNLMGMLLARDQYCLKHMNGHSIQHQGLPHNAHKFRIFTSQVSHFSVQKAAALLGLGYDAVISVPVDKNFRMDVDALEKALKRVREEGNIPIATVATMGTTDYGSIDPIHPIADICKRENIWLHADAAYGCGLLISQRYGQRINGIDLADSVTVDFHKSFFQPVACGAFFCKDKQDLTCVTYHAEYLNPLSQANEGTPNLVCKSLQTTRRFDALKLWLTLRITGPEALGAAFDRVIDLAEDAYTAFKHDQCLEFIHHPTISTLVFRFKPRIYQDEASVVDVNEINQNIRKRLARSGELLIASTKWQGDIYLKLTLLNPDTTVAHVGDALHKIKATGEILARQQSSVRPLSVVTEPVLDFAEEV